MRSAVVGLLLASLCASSLVADDYGVILDSYGELELIAGLGQVEDELSLSG